LQIISDIDLFNLLTFSIFLGGIEFNITLVEGAKKTHIIKKDGSSGIVSLDFIFGIDGALLSFPKVELLMMKHSLYLSGERAEPFSILYHYLTFEEDISLNCLVFYLLLGEFV
jgi:hypothetical protein